MTTPVAAPSPSPPPASVTNVIIRFFQEVNKVFLKLINWVIAITPLAVFSLITKAIGTQSNVVEALSNIGWLITCLMTGFTLHLILFASQ